MDTIAGATARRNMSQRGMIQNQHQTLKVFRQNQRELSNPALCCWTQIHIFRVVDNNMQTMTKCQIHSSRKRAMPSPKILASKNNNLLERR